MASTYELIVTVSVALASTICVAFYSHKDFSSK
jgi:hypothetical protein